MEARGHTEACRQRIEAKLEEEQEPRLSRAKKRRDDEGAAAGSSADHAKDDAGMTEAHVKVSTGRDEDEAGRIDEVDERRNIETPSPQLAESTEQRRTAEEDKTSRERDEEEDILVSKRRSIVKHKAARDRETEELEAGQDKRRKQAQAPLNVRSSDD